MTVDNTAGTENLTLRKIQNLLPLGLEYVGVSPLPWQNSTTIATIIFQGRKLVTWRFNTPLVVPAGQSTTLDFDAKVTAPPLGKGENYWSDVWFTARVNGFPLLGTQTGTRSRALG